MCGIAGTIGLPFDVAERALTRMRLALEHRGPDGRGTEFLSSAAGTHPVGLAHTRLAIIDTSKAGHQPMRDASGAWISFNGEIYNFAAVRRQLEARGLAFQGRTDTEVILRGYAAHGPDSVDALRGMFAFALADPAKGVVWLCRDRLGIKPLYVARPASGGVLFASEVRAILAVGRELIRPRVSATALESFLAQGMVCGHDSIVEGFSAIAPGTSLVLDWNGREISQRRYWSLPSSAMPLVWTSRGEAVSRVATTLREAVDGHLVSDVPLGLFLSGGIDSSALATIATEVSSDVQTLSIGFDQPRFDESQTAADVASDLGAEHSTVRLTGDEMLSDMGEVFRAMDQPTVDGFNTYFVSRAARRAGLTVALSGIGGDELFGGYDTFRDVPRALALAQVANRLGASVFAHTNGEGPGFRPPLAGRAAAKVVELLHRDPSLASVYLLRRELFLAPERGALHPRPRGSDPSVGLPVAELAELASISSKADPTNAIAAYELAHYLRHMLLRDADVFSMAVGLEVRVPLLDHELVDVVAPLPGRWKRPAEARAKPLLLDAVGPRLPRSVETRKKRGFTFPWQGWLFGPLRDRARRALADRDVWRSLGVDEGAPGVMWQRFLAKDPRVGALQIIALWVLGEYAQRHSLLPAA
jgi:asparagine synthase (glutamine-hydrolysing)